jgi:hypothetical protein
MRASRHDLAGHHCGDRRHRYMTLPRCRSGPASALFPCSRRDGSWASLFQPLPMS